MSAARLCSGREEMSGAERLDNAAGRADSLLTIPMAEDDQSIGFYKLLHSLRVGGTQCLATFFFFLLSLLGLSGGLHNGTFHLNIPIAQAADITYVYDELGRLTAVIDPAGDTATYAYDAVGNILSIEPYPSTELKVLQVTPSSAAAGSSITLYGTGFSAVTGQNTVTFNGVPGTVTLATPTILIVTVPPNATTGPIRITTPAGSFVTSV